MSNFGLAITALLGFGPLLAGNTASVRLLVVDVFGKPGTGCVVDEFVDERDATNYEANNRRDYSARFNGLHAEGIPYGSYWIVVRCHDGNRGNQQVAVLRPDTFFVVTSAKQRGDQFAGGRPRLQITIENAGTTPQSDLWIRAINPFGTVDETARIDPVDSTARFYLLYPGTYMILLVRPGNILCKYSFELLNPGASISLASEGSFCRLKSASPASSIRELL